MSNQEMGADGRISCVESGILARPGMSLKIYVAKGYETVVDGAASPPPTRKNNATMTASGADQRHEQRRDAPAVMVRGPTGLYQDDYYQVPPGREASPLLGTVSSPLANA